MKIETLTTAEEALRSLSEKLISIIGQSRVNPFHIALSGGKTAQTLFKIWTKEYKERIPWDILRFYWVDERCVAPDDDESNFKHAEQLLFPSFANSHRPHSPYLGRTRSQYRGGTLLGNG